MTKRFFYRLFLRLFARQIVKDAYQGVLARPADATGLSEYCRALAKRRDLAWLTSDLLASGEARGRLGVAAPPELVTQAFLSVLRRTPTNEELVAHVARLAEGQSIQALLADLLAGRAGPGMLPQDEAEDLVRAAFRALLNREPEPTALADYTHLLVDTGDVAAFLHEVGHCQEHIDKLGDRLRGRPGQPSLRRPRALSIGH